MSALFAARVSRPAGRRSPHSAVSIPTLTMWLSLTCAPASEAGVITVDQQNCNLVDAIIAANTDAPAGGCPAGSGPDWVELTQPIYTLSQPVVLDPFRVSGLPEINSDIKLVTTRGGNEPNVVIQGPAPDGTSFPLVRVREGASLRVSRVTFRYGYGGSRSDPGVAGGITNRGVLELNDSTVSDCQAAFLYGEAGGIYNGGTANLNRSKVTGNSKSGITNVGTLTLQDSLVSGNGATESGDCGICNDGRLFAFNTTVTGNRTGIRNSLLADLTNSTISGNGAGGLLNAGVARLNYVTVAWNQGGPGGQGALDSSGKLTLQNSIVANSIGADCRGSVDFSGVNLIGDGSCAASAAGALTGDPRLGLLTDNGGVTPTHALLAGSPAVDASQDVPPYSPSQDQRYVQRPQGEKPDLGAFEGTVIQAIGTWQLAPGERSYAGNLDRDRRIELFVQNGRHAAVLERARGGWVSRVVAGGWIGRWRLGSGDRSYIGDFDGDGKAEIFTRNVDSAALIRLRGNSLRSSARMRGNIGEWPLNADDEACIGDLDGDGRDEIFIYREATAAVLSDRNGRFGSSTVTVSPIGSWPLAAGDLCYSGDFDGDGRAEIFMRNAHQAGLLSYTGAALNSKTVATRSVGAWQLNPGDRSTVGDFDGDRKAEIVVYNHTFPPGYLGVLGYDGSQLVSESVMQGPLYRWQLTDADKFYAGDFKGMGFDGLFVRRPRAAGVLSYDGIGFWQASTAAYGRIGKWPLQAGDVSTVGDFDGDGAAEIYVRNGDRAAEVRYRGGRLRSSVLTGGH